MRLEFRVCRELAGLPDGKLRGLWCDGFVPTQWCLNDTEPTIAGRTWLGSGPRLEEWWFTLFLPQPVRSLEELEVMDWTVLLPPDNVTCWLAIDAERKRIEIEPAAGVPDPA